MRGKFPKEIAGARVVALFERKESLEIRYEDQGKERAQREGIGEALRSLCGGGAHRAGESAQDGAVTASLTDQYRRHTAPKDYLNDLDRESKSKRTVKMIR